MSFKSLEGFDHRQEFMLTRNPNQVRESAVTEELEKYGWRMNRVLNTNFVSDSYVDKKGVLRDFNLPADTKITEKFLSTAA